MNVEPKILLTIQLEGVLGQRTEKKEAIPFKIETFEGETISGVKTHYPRENSSCRKKVVIPQCAYEYFISDEQPYWYSTKKKELIWPNLPKSARLQLHLQRIAEYNEFSYEIIEN